MWDYSNGKGCCRNKWGRSGGWRVLKVKEATNGALIGKFCGGVVIAGFGHFGHGEVRLD